MGAGRGVGVLACELGRRLAARFCWTKTTRTGTVLEPAAEDGRATCAMRHSEACNAFNIANAQ